MTQYGLDFQPRDSHVLNPAEQMRLAGQTLKVMERLMQGPATNRELADISLKYTSRISDLRKALKPMHRDVKVVHRCYETGVTVYQLVDVPGE